MADRVALSAGVDNFGDCVALAGERGLGVEIMAFSMPHILDGDWRGMAREYQAALADMAGPLTLHGPFMDLVSGSPDERLNQVARGRYEQALRIAAELSIPQVVLHANYIGLLHNDSYRQGWHQRNVDFWGPLAEYARARDIVIAIENMWEFDPTIIGDLLRDLDHPNARACIDIGHAGLYSDPGVTLAKWLAELRPWVVELHLNNNDGVMDEHHGFDWERGALDYAEILPQLRQALDDPCDGAGDGSGGRYGKQPALF